MNQFNFEKQAPFMHKDEYNFIQSFLNKESAMLEWGSGGSTLYFSKFVDEYYSLEHNRQWYNKIRKMLEEEAISNVNYIFISSDPPNWDRPINWRSVLNYSTPTKYFKNYIDCIERFDRRFDYILIDGRCRSQCALKSLFYLKDDGVLFFHDFYPRKKYGYHNVLEFFDEIDGIKHTSQTVIALKKKEEYKNLIDSLSVDEITNKLNNLQSNIKY
tara:strand:- start:1864 stop:2508 length:645 start_codon:yes stop_codon:yes gene_type:complete